jgi:hypothetical protein
MVLSGLFINRRENEKVKINDDVSLPSGGRGTPKEEVEKLFAVITAHLTSLRDFFPPGVKITCVVRDPEERLINRMVVSNDAMDEVLKVIQENQGIFPDLGSLSQDEPQQ